MADMRYALTDGDRTSTGGVLEASFGPSSTIEGRQMALEGDIATCPACQSQGRVFNDCHPNFDVHGKQLLVSGARVHCQCPDKPYVLPSHMNFTVEVDRRGRNEFLAPEGTSDWEGNAGSSAPWTATHSYDEQFRIVDTDGEAIAGVPFYIRDGAGHVHTGVTDEFGCCPRVCTRDKETLRVVLGVDALELWERGR